MFLLFLLHFLSFPFSPSVLCLCFTHTIGLSPSHFSPWNWSLADWLSWLHLFPRLAFVCASCFFFSFYFVHSPLFHSLPCSPPTLPQQSFFFSSQLISLHLPSLHPPAALLSCTIPSIPFLAKMVLDTKTGLGCWISIPMYTDTPNSRIYIFSITLIAQCHSKLANTN